MAQDLSKLEFIAQVKTKTKQIILKGTRIILHDKPSSGLNTKELP